MADFASRPAMTRAAGPWMAVALVAMVAAVALGIAYLTRDGGATASAPVTARFTIVLPDGVDVVNANLAPLAIAPNGQIVAFSGRRAGRSQLYVHDVSTGETKALDGTDDARSPFFSPDGRWIGFFARGKLKKMAVTGTSLLDVADAPDSRGGTWAADDVIYYALTNTSGLWKVAASGGAAAGVTTLDP